MKFLKSIILILFLTVTSAGNSQNNNSGDIWAYRENYVPQKYEPLPEFMVFVDMAILIIIISIGLYFVIKRKAPSKLSWLAVVTLVYLGLIRGGCICPVGMISNVTFGLINPTDVGLVEMIIFLVPLIVALIAGRVFCTAGCPLGAVQHLFFKRKKHYKIPSKLNSILKIAPVILILISIYAAVTAQYYLVCKLEPYKVAFFTGKNWIDQIISFLLGNSVEAKFLWTFGIFSWIYLIVMIAVGYWIPRPFCRFMCPYGVLLGLISLVSFKPRRINAEKCTLCGLCQRVCPTQAITIDRKNKISKLSNYSCVQCNLCSKNCKSGAI